MAKQHPYAAEFTSFIQATQQCYETWQLEAYLAAFSLDYCAVQLHTGFHEDLDQLHEKITADFIKFELLDMDFMILDQWFAGDMGFAHMTYRTRLRSRDTGRILFDERENLVVARHIGAGSWLIDAKVTMSADVYYESESKPPA